MNIPAKKQDIGTTIEDVLVRGDLSQLTPQQRTEYVFRLCESLKLNPLTQPFEFLLLNGKLVLYAKRACTDQLRKINGISVEIVSREIADDLMTVHVRAKDKDGRTDEDFGVVPFKHGATEIQANLTMKCITKAKRRVTLSISGLGFLDETEIPTSRERLSGAVISERQLNDLIVLADQVGADKRAFVQYLSDRWETEVPSLADIPASYFDDAMSQLKRKADAIDKADAEASGHPS